MIKVTHAVVGPVMTNCYLCIHEETREALIIDPGDEPEKIRTMIQKNEAVPVAVLLTHGHFDHIGAVDALRAEYHIPVYADAAEREVLGTTSKNLSSKMSRKPVTVKADHELHDGECLKLAGMEIKMLSTPGHTPGGCCYYIEEGKLLFSGDTLFCCSVGRTDFEGGSLSRLIHGIKEKLFTLPDDTVVYPGHDCMTRIGYEKENNPYAV